MKRMGFSDAIESALGQAMSEDPRIIILGEDVQMLRANLALRFGPERVRSTPISESAFVGAAVSAAMAGLHPVVEVMLADFAGVAMDSLLNHAAKLETFSGGHWHAPLVVRMACGGGYGDAGQHEQSLWGWFAHIPGLAVVVPSTPADAGSLLLAALQWDGPVLFLEHKLLSQAWLEFMGSGGRKTVQFAVPPEGAYGTVPDHWEALPLGQAAVRRPGSDLTMVSLGVSVHRCLEAAEQLRVQGIRAGVLDLRTVSPLDRATLCSQLNASGRLLAVDEDYQGFGLSGELAAVALEEGISIRYRRVCTERTIPYSRHLEDQTLPNTTRIFQAALELMDAQT